MCAQELAHALPVQPERASDLVQREALDHAQAKHLVLTLFRFVRVDLPDQDLYAEELQHEHHGLQLDCALAALEPVDDDWVDAGEAGDMFVRERQLLTASPHDAAEFDRRVDG